MTQGEFGGTTLPAGVRGKARWGLLSEEDGSAIENGGFALQRAEHTQVLLKLAELHGMQHLT